MSLMCHSKAEKTLRETTVLSRVREVTFKGNSKACFGQLAYDANKYKTSITWRKARLWSLCVKISINLKLKTSMFQNLYFCSALIHGRTGWKPMKDTHLPLATSLMISPGCWYQWLTCRLPDQCPSRKVTEILPASKSEKHHRVTIRQVWRHWIPDTGKKYPFMWNISEGLKWGKRLW